MGAEQQGETGQESTELEQVADDATANAGDDKAGEVSPDKQVDADESVGDNKSDATEKGKSRWARLANANREFKQKNAEQQQKLAELEQQLKSMEGAASFDKMLRSDPKKLEAVMKILTAEAEKNEVEKEEIPLTYDEFEEIPAKKFKQIDLMQAKLDEVLEFIDGFKEHQNKQREQFVTRNQQVLDDTFDEMLTKIGISDDRVEDKIKKAVIGELASMTDNPYLATKDQLIDAFNDVVDTFGLKKIKDVPPPPTSGSKNGSAKLAPKVLSDEERISEMAKRLRG